jgi:hypothetical protein
MELKGLDGVKRWEGLNGAERTGWCLETDGRG